jgi:hypothetical protein
VRHLQIACLAEVGGLAEQRFGLRRLAPLLQQGPEVAQAARVVEVGGLAVQRFGLRRLAPLLQQGPEVAQAARAGSGASFRVRPAHHLHLCAARNAEHEQYRCSRSACAIGAGIATVRLPAYDFTSWGNAPPPCRRGQWPAYRFPHGSSEGSRAATSRAAENAGPPMCG